MKHKQGAIKYDIEEIVEVDVVDESTFFNSDKNVKFKYIRSDRPGKGGVGVGLHKDESFESLLKRFKKSMLESGVLKEYQDSLVYEKPSVIAKRKRNHRKYKARNAAQNTK